MVRDVSNSRGPGHDLLCSARSAFLLWYVPWCAFALGFREPPVLRTILWTTSLAFMGIACLLNASRCGRPLLLHRTVSDSLRCCLARIWAWTFAAWAVRMEIDWRRNNYRSGRAHLHSRTRSWPLSAKWSRCGLTNQ
jgi:hypothetical protein